MSIVDNMKNVLVGAVGNLFDAETKSLNLSNVVASIGPLIPNYKGLSFQNKAFVNEIFNIIRSYCADMISLNLADNNIASLASFRFLFQHAPELKNLSLEGNLIENINELNHLEGLRTRLIELIFRNNPATKGSFHCVWCFQLQIFIRDCIINV